MNFVSVSENFGTFVINTTEQWGRSWIFLYRTLIALIRPPYRPYLYLQQLLQIGVNSTLVIALIGLFTGAVLAVQGEYTLSKFGATAYTGPAVALGLIRELGPVLTALMVIGRAGSAVTAELGIMRITEQIDALRSMAVDPIKYLMALCRWTDRDATLMWNVQRRWYLRRIPRRSRALRIESWNLYESDYVSHRCGRCLVRIY